MNDTTPVGRITALLNDSGYRSIPTPLIIGGVRFDFPAALVGGSFSPDLVLVADTAYDEESRIVAKVEGVARSLDVARSKRPLTVIVVGPRPSASTIESMARVCRVLPTGTISHADPAISLQNWVAVLLPLRLPEVHTSIATALEQIDALAEDLDPKVANLIAVARQGSRAVQRQLHQIVDDAVVNSAEGESS